LKVPKGVIRSNTEDQKKNDKKTNNDLQNIARKAKDRAQLTVQNIARKAKDRAQLTLQNIARKAKDRAQLTLQNGSERRCSGKIDSSCSTSCTHRVTRIRHAMSRERMGLRFRQTDHLHVHL
jgi:ribosomal protein L34